MNILLAFVAFAKDTALAAYFGTSSYADALSLAFFIPDSIGNSIIAAALGIAAVPVFSQIYTKNKMSKRFQYGVQLLLRDSIVIGAVLMLLVWTLQAQIIHGFGAGLDNHNQLLFRQLLFILTPLLMLFPIMMIFNAAAQSMELYYVSGASQTVFNLIYLVVIMMLMIAQVTPYKGTTVTAIGIDTAAAFAILYILNMIKKNGVLIAARIPANHSFEEKLLAQKDRLQIYRILWPYASIFLASQLVYVIERYLAAGLEVGTIASLNYAYRLSQFPIWIFVTAINLVVFPILSRNQSNKEKSQSVLQGAVQITILVTIPASLLFFFGRRWIVSLLFEHGLFDQHSVEVTATILSGYSLAIVGQAVSAVYLRYFAASGQIYAPAVLFIASSLANVGFDFWFVPLFGASGIGYGAAIAALLNVLLILLWMKIKA